MSSVAGNRAWSRVPFCRGQIRHQDFEKALAGLAMRTGIGADRKIFPQVQRNQQPGHHRPAAGVRTEYVIQKRPQGNQQSIEPLAKHYSRSEEGLLDQLAQQQPAKVQVRLPQQITLAINGTHTSSGTTCPAVALGVPFAGCPHVRFEKNKNDTSRRRMGHLAAHR